MNNSYIKVLKNVGEKRNKFSFVGVICTLNFVFTLLGYSLIVGSLSNLIPQDLLYSSSITWPVRGAFLMITILAFVFGKSRNGKIDFPMILFIIFTLLYLLRAMADLLLTSSGSFNPSFAWRIRSYDPNFYFQAWSYIVLFTIIPLISIYRSWEQIDYQLALDIIICLGTIACMSSFGALLKGGVAIVGIDAESRVSASALLNTIAFGHLGVSLALMAIYRFFYSGHLSIWKPICIVVAILGMVTMMRAGSRGPIVAFLFAIVLFAATFARNVVLSCGLALICCVIVYIARDILLNMVEFISPALYTRIDATLSYGEASGREYMFIEYLKEVFSHPLFGFQLDLLGYSHNVFIDAFMMFGLFAGWIIPIILLVGIYRAIGLLKYRIAIGWISLLYFQAFASVQFSGCIGGNSFLQGSLFVIFLFFMKYKNALGNSLINRI